MEIYVTAGLFVLAGIGAFVLWRLSRKYEARRQIERVAEIQERQLEAGNRAPRTVEELAKRLREGGQL